MMLVVPKVKSVVEELLPPRSDADRAPLRRRCSVRSFSNSACVATQMSWSSCRWIVCCSKACLYFSATARQVSLSCLNSATMARISSAAASISCDSVEMCDTKRIELRK
jgi:hypothetical protein